LQASALPFEFYLLTCSTAKLPLALEIAMILAIDLGTDLIPAICLAYEEAEDEVMKRKPRNSSTDRLTSLQAFASGYGVQGPLEAIWAFFVFFSVFWSFGFWHSDLLGGAIDFKKSNSLVCGDKCCPAWYSAYPKHLREANSTYAAEADMNMCLFRSCISSDNERLQFFCDQMYKNDYWMRHAPEFIAQGWTFADFRVFVLKQAQSAFLFTICMGQIANGLCVKSHLQSLFVCGLKNKNLAKSFVFEIALIFLICYSPGIQDVFGTSSFNVRFVGLSLVIIPTMITVEEGRKWFARNFPANFKSTNLKGDIVYVRNTHPLSWVARIFHY
jgi:magnesium-transporting ATPase (P-type)